MEEYRVEYYKNSSTGREPVADYLDGLRDKEHNKILRHIELLRLNGGRLVEPYAKHVEGKIWELRIQFSPLHHRVLYVIVAERLIILLHAFTKKTPKLPTQELNQAYRNLEDALTNIHNYYEDEKAN